MSSLLILCYLCNITKFYALAVGAAVRMNSSVDYIYPTDLRREAQVTIPAQLINEEQVVGKANRI